MFIDETMNKYVLYKTICYKMAVLETRALQNKIKHKKVYLDNEKMILLMLIHLFTIVYVWCHHTTSILVQIDHLHISHNASDALEANIWIFQLSVGLHSQKKEKYPYIDLQSRCIMGYVQMVN